MLLKISDIKFSTLLQKTFTPSPRAWEDHVLYFLLVDRFSDNHEIGYFGNAGEICLSGNTPLFVSAEKGNACRSEESRRTWQRAGDLFVGGNLKGLKSKIGYLKRLGITALWISPVFKQVSSKQTYHGYGIQNFLEIEPRFGTKEDLIAMVKEAHQQGIYVILDIILNHCGDVFEYEPDRYPAKLPSGLEYMDATWDGMPYKVKGYRNGKGVPDVPFQPFPDGVFTDEMVNSSIWPYELQNPDTFTRKGRIVSWDAYPEYAEGDFFGLKDIYHGTGDETNYDPSAALKNLCEIYKYWIALADLDGFRIDTVKHMDRGAVRYFTAQIKNFAHDLGKHNFYLIGEIAGGRVKAFDTMVKTGLDAALGIEDLQDSLENLAKGKRNPSTYFSQFSNSPQLDQQSCLWLRNNVITLFDDHDEITKGPQKARFCGDPGADKLLPVALALNLTTLGIPCIYYGTEQFFDGSGNSDRYLREAMFGGSFGAFCSQGFHFFDEKGLVYQEIKKIIALRKKYEALRKGTQYLREISVNKRRFRLPQMIQGKLHGVVAWSRILDEQEILLAVNTDPEHDLSVWVRTEPCTKDASENMHLVYSSKSVQEFTTVEVQTQVVPMVFIRVPAAGFVMYVRNL